MNSHYFANIGVISIGVIFSKCQENDIGAILANITPRYTQYWLATRDIKIKLYNNYLCLGNVSKMSPIFYIGISLEIFLMNSQYFPILVVAWNYFQCKANGEILAQYCAKIYFLLGWWFAFVMYLKNSGNV